MIRVDYKTLAAIAGVIVAITLFLVMLDSMDAREESARASKAKDEQIERRDKALGDAALQSERNGQQIGDLIKQVDALTDTITTQESIVSALRNELAKRGISTVIENGKVRVVPGPVSTGSGQVSTRGSATTPTRSTVEPSVSPTSSLTPRPTVSTPSLPSTPTSPVVIGPPLPVPTLTLPVPSLPTICVLIVCTAQPSEGTP